LPAISILNRFDKKEKKKMKRKRKKDKKEEKRRRSKSHSRLIQYLKQSSQYASQ